MITKQNISSIVGGSLLILFGLFVLFGQLFQGWQAWTSYWPVAIIGAGALFFVAAVAGGKSTAALAIPASIITVTGLILLVQALTDYWESWSYAWTLIVIAVGFGNFVMGAYVGNQSARQAGLRTMGFGFLMFVLFGAFFEGLIFTEHNLRWLGQVFLPIGVILTGVYVLLFRSGLLGRKNPDTSGQEEPPTSMQ